jgi:hypothetical protein
MTNFTDSIEKFFDVNSVPEPIKEADIPAQLPEVVPETPLDVVPPDPPLKASLNDNLEDAYTKTRSNLEDIITQSKGALEKVLKVAVASESPRAYEVYGNLVKSVVEANRELLETEKKVREMTGEKAGPVTNKIDKAIFVGTTAELNKMLKDKEKNVSS